MSKHRKRGHLSAAHRKAISEGLLRYHKNKHKRRKTHHAHIPKRKVGSRGKGSYKNYKYSKMPNGSYGWKRKRR